MGARKRTAGPTLFPAFGYRDAIRAIDWLTRTFGLESSVVHPGPDGSVIHAELKLGSGVLMVGTWRPGSANAWQASHHGIYAYVPDVDAHYQRARAAGAEIVRTPHDTSYGAREYSVRDLEGNLWSFGTYLPE